MMFSSYDTKVIPDIIITDHPLSKVIMSEFAQGFKSQKYFHINNYKLQSRPIASYGYLRGVGDLYKKSGDFWYIDHGYFKQSSRSFQNKVIVKNLDGYFRIVNNNFWHSNFKKMPSIRFDKLNINVSPQKSNGDYILISEPTTQAAQYYNLKDWTSKTILRLKKYTDRPVIIHNRSSNIPLDQLLANAWAFVSDHSSAGFLALAKGIPAVYTNKSLEYIGRIEDIEKLNIDENIFFYLAYGQWKLDEIRSGEAWEFLSNNNI